jgi:hypothetical protein
MSGTGKMVLQFTALLTGMLLGHLAVNMAFGAGQQNPPPSQPRQNSDPLSDSLSKAYEK